MRRVLTLPSILLCMFPLSAVVTKLEKLAVTISRSEGGGPLPLLLPLLPLLLLEEVDMMPCDVTCHSLCRGGHYVDEGVI